MVNLVACSYEFNTVRINHLPKMQCCCQMDVNYHNQVFDLPG